MAIPALLLLPVIFMRSAHACCPSASQSNMLGNLNMARQAQFPFAFGSDMANCNQGHEESCGPPSPSQDHGSLASTSNILQETQTPLYSIQPIPGKGLGLIALQPIPPGTKILIESPLLTVSMPEMVEGQGFRINDMVAEIDLKFKLLSLEQQKEVEDLHDHRFPGDGSSRLLTIFRSNAYNTGDDHVGLFPKTARINHSCRPNCGNFWSEKNEERVIYAQREIKEGEEITVSYIPLLKSIKERQMRLQQYGFVCDCSACRSEESSKRRVRINDLLEELEMKAVKSFGGGESKKKEIHGKLAQKAEKLVKMMEEEGLGDYLARAFRLASVFNSRRSNSKLAIEWAVKELELHQWAEMQSAEALATMKYVRKLKDGRQ
ncbi:SET domain-containing protein [Stipitochalara longipes BDJ]|nr:SET domain-containing protein [Stipitochalara longipes BDJ]